MSFFSFGGRAALATAAGFSKDLLHQNECILCPLNDAKICSPKMKPTGTRKPVIYFLGEAPGPEEDRLGRPFVGSSGKLLKRHIPPEVLALARWGNVVRCYPGKDEHGKINTPGPIEIETCRPSVIRDIEATQPTAIFGFGNVPLNWLIGETGITKWSGRRIPVKVGKHVCWYYPFVHPAAILHNKPEYHPGEYESEDEFALAFQLKRAIRELDDLPAPVVHDEEEALRGLEIITGHGGEADLARLKAFLAELDAEFITGFDYETNAIRPYVKKAKLLSVALAGSKRAVSCALSHKQTGWTPKQLKTVHALLLKFLLSRGLKRRLVAHQLPFEVEWSATWFGDEVIWNTGWGDTASQAYILDERPWTLSLEFLIKQYFGFSIKGIDNLDRNTLDDAPLENVLRYNALDSKYARLVFNVQEKRLKDEGLFEVYRHQLERTVAVVPTQLNGVPINEETNLALKTKYERRLAKIEGTIESHEQAQLYKRRTGGIFRPSALDDVRRYLVLVLGLTQFEKKHGMQVDEATLREIDDPIIKLVLRWRKLNKILSTYIKPVQRGGDHVQADGYMHPIISTTKTRTWRTASEEPNTQNWPIRDPAAVEARTQVSKKERNCVVVAFDFAGIQARNVAMESGDAALIKHFHERYDIHTDWMMRLAKLDPRWARRTALEKDKALFKKHRHQAKNKFVFPSFFGARPKSISRALGIEMRIADKLQRAFWNEFPDIKAWQEQLVKSYYKLGYVTGLSGFRRRAPVIHNELINSPIQSDESRIVCGAMVRVARLGLPCTMEIHDDLTFIWPKKKVDEYSELVITEMLRIDLDWINVPLEVERKIGPDWGTMEDAGKFESVGKDSWKELT